MTQVAAKVILRSRNSPQPSALIAELWKVKDNKERFRRGAKTGEYDGHVISTPFYSPTPCVNPGSRRSVGEPSERNV